MVYGFEIIEYGQPLKTTKINYFSYLDDVYWWRIWFKFWLCYQIWSEFMIWLIHGQSKTQRSPIAHSCKQRLIPFLVLSHTQIKSDHLPCLLGVTKWTLGINRDFAPNNLSSKVSREPTFTIRGLHENWRKPYIDYRKSCLCEKVVK